MATPDLSDVHEHLADAALSLARAAGASDDARDLLPLARLITAAQEELLRVTRPGTRKDPPG